MTQERRRARRWSTAIECSWTRDARITDLSTSGCYVYTRYTPKVGDHVEFTATIQDQPAQLCGTVAASTQGVGFGVAFDRLPEATTAALLAVLEQVARERA